MVPWYKQNFKRIDYGKKRLQSSPENLKGEIQTQTASRSPDSNHWNLIVDLGSTDEIYETDPSNAGEPSEMPRKRSFGKLNVTKLRDLRERFWARWRSVSLSEI